MRSRNLLLGTLVASSFAGIAFAGIITAPSSGSSGAPSGPAGGDLTGNYPNPTIAATTINTITGSVGSPAATAWNIDIGSTVVCSVLSSIRFQCNNFSATGTGIGAPTANTFLWGATPTTPPVLAAPGEAANYIDGTLGSVVAGFPDITFLPGSKNAVASFGMQLTSSALTMGSSMGLVVPSTGSETFNNLTASSLIYTNSTSQLSSTPPSSGLPFPSVWNCTTSACAQVTQSKVVKGFVTLSSGSVSIPFTGVGFTGNDSCTVTDLNAGVTGNLVWISTLTSTGVTFKAATGVNDSIFYICAGN